MAVVIRLQGLPMVAGTMDIRHFFSGLTIPDGGVHIVGGEHGEAFIVFATDEDARLGMMRTGGAIKTSKVSLLLSSKTEMQNMIELSRRRFEAAPVVSTETQASPAAAASNRQSGPPVAPGNQPGGGGRGGGHGNPGGGAHEQQGKAPPPCLPSMLPFSNSYSPSPSLAPPIPPLPSLPLPSPVPSPSPQSHSHAQLAHMTSMPPFNPSMPPPGSLGSGLGPNLSLGPGLSSGLPLGAPGPLLFSPLAPLAQLGLQAHMKAPGAPPDQQVVLLQNLPFSVCEAEVRDFLRGLGVEGVRLLRDGQGRGTGRALVRFFLPQDGREAAQRGGGMMGQRFIEIAPATERQWASLNGSVGPAPLNNTLGNTLSNTNNHNSSSIKTNSGSEEQQQQHRRGNAGSVPPRDRARSRSPQRPELCVYLKGLPYEAEPRQLQDFFKGLSIVEDSVYIAYGPNGRATGEGFLEFGSEQDYKVALGSHMQYMGSRFIQVHPVSRRAMLEKIEAIRKRGSTPADGGKARNCAHITNLPYNIARKDVRAFLEGVGIYEDSLKVLTDHHGNGLGQAVFQLRTEEDARQAERLHRQKLNGRDAFVHLVTYEQMKEVERNPPAQNKRGQRAAAPAPPQQGQQPPGPQPPGHINPFAGMSGEEFSFLRSTMGTLGAAPFVSPFSAPGLAGPPPLPPLAGLGDGCLGSAPPLLAGLPGPPLGLPGPLGPDALRGLLPFDAGRKPGGGASGNGGPGGVASGNSQVRSGGGGPPGGNDSLRNQPAPGGPGNPGNHPGGGPTVVKLQNMPFTVTVDEILDFFYGYQVLPGSVCLQLGPKGLPTGQAMVAFQAPAEAAAAVADLNDRPIGARKVKISLG